MYWELVNRLPLYGSGYLPGPETGEARCLLFSAYFTIKRLCSEIHLYEFLTGHHRRSWLRYFRGFFRYVKSKCRDLTRIHLLHMCILLFSI